MRVLSKRAKSNFIFVIIPQRQFSHLAFYCSERKTAFIEIVITNDKDNGTKSRSCYKFNKIQNISKL